MKSLTSSHPSATSASDTIRFCCILITTDYCSQRLLLAQGCCYSPGNLRRLSTQRSPTHHRLQCPNTEPYSPVFYVPAGVESHEDSWFSCRSDKVLFFSWNVCCKANLRDQALLPTHEKFGYIARLICVGKNQPGIGTNSPYCTDCQALSMQQQLLLSL